MPREAARRGAVAGAVAEGEGEPHDVPGGGGRALVRPGLLRGAAGGRPFALVSGDFDVLPLVRTADNRKPRELVLTRVRAMPAVLSTRTSPVFEERDLPPDGQPTDEFSRGAGSEGDGPPSGGRDARRRAR